MRWRLVPVWEDTGPDGEGYWLFHVYQKQGWFRWYKYRDLYTIDEALGLISGDSQ